MDKWKKRPSACVFVCDGTSQLRHFCRMRQNSAVTKRLRKGQGGVNPSATRLQISHRCLGYLRNVLCFGFCCSRSFPWIVVIVKRWGIYIYICIHNYVWMVMTGSAPCPWGSPDWGDKADHPNLWAKKAQAKLCVNKSMLWSILGLPKGEGDPITQRSGRPEAGFLCWALWLLGCNCSTWSPPHLKNA